MIGEAFETKQSKCDWKKLMRICRDGIRWERMDMSEATVLSKRSEAEQSEIVWAKRLRLNTAIENENEQNKGN